MESLVNSDSGLMATLATSMAATGTGAEGGGAARAAHSHNACEKKTKLDSTCDSRTLSPSLFRAPVGAMADGKFFQTTKKGAPVAVAAARSRAGGEGRARWGGVLPTLSAGFCPDALGSP